METEGETEAIWEALEERMSVVETKRGMVAKGEGEEEAAA